MPRSGFVNLEHLLLALCAVMAPALPLTAGTYMVDVSDEAFILYACPFTGNEVKLGGLSGLCPVPRDRTGTLFFATTDRGPSGDYGEEGKFFLDPYGYTPSILTIQLLENGTATILDILPLKKPNGQPVTGIPNPCVPHEEPIVDLDQDDVALDPDGLDPEGISVDMHGNFWLCEEFRPSIFMARPDGTVVLRLVPHGTLCGGEEIPTYGVLPGIYGSRQTNKALEGISVAPNNHLFAVIQRPLCNPDADTNKRSRNLRILELNLNRMSHRSGSGPRQWIRQYLYITEENEKQSKVYASSIAAVTPTRFLVAERETDAVFMVSRWCATDITRFEDDEGRLRADPSRTIEQLAPEELAALGIRPVRKRVIVPITTDLDESLGKAEGIALVGSTLVLCADNDFNLDEEGMEWSTTPATVALQDPPNLPRIVTVPLRSPASRLASD